jgi:hypothetical protein
MAVKGPRIGIRQYREALGLSVSELVQRLKDERGFDTHPDTIRNVELGHKPASKPLMTAWIRVLGLTPLDVEQDPAHAARVSDEQVA